MTLRKKTLFILAFTLGSLFLLLYGVSHVILKDSYTRLETSDIQDQTQRAFNTLAAETSQMESAVADWAYWDDTYQFIADRNADYIASNLTVNTFINLNLSLMLFVRSDGTIVYQQAFESASGEVLPVPDAVRQHFGAGSELWRLVEQGGVTSGILNLPDYPVLVAISPILTSSREGPSRGVLVFGRALDTSEMQRLSDTVFLPLSLFSVENEMLPDDVREAVSAVTANSRLYVQPLDETICAGYGLLDDIYGRPTLLLRVEVERDVYQQGQISLTYIMVLMVVMGGVFCVVILITLERLVLARISQLSVEVSRVDGTNNASRRISLEGRDELARLGMTINETLEALAQSREELHTSEELLQTVADGAPVVLVAVDLDGVYTLVRGRGLKKLGLEPEQIIGRSVYETNPVVPELSRSVHSALEDGTLSKSIPIGGMVFDIHYASLRDQSGNIAGIIGVATDITERKQAEQERIAAERLRLELEKERDLVQMKERFVSHISHEFRTPLAVILSSKEALQRYYDRLTPERRDEHYHEIECQVRRLTGMLDDVLTINKARAGKFDYRPEPMNLETFCYNLLEQTRLVIANGTGHQFFFQAIGNFSDVVMDTTLLQHIFLNLLGNAVKYSPDRSVIRFEVRRDNDDVVFHVIDQGMGIPEAEQGQLFEPFFRASNSRQHSGTGLGLAIVQESVQVHGGQITFASQPGQGTTFVVRLPVKPLERPDESR